ncbi:MAG: DUF2007 domain-containing protein [Alphaproteobacteria bacterium]|nr:DUF2007 domain-containing protein [Alphaproteobacteria bacterium]
MKELLRTNDPVLLSLLMARLKDAAIEAVVLDSHMSVLEGSANAIPRRVMVADDDLARAERVLEETEQT